MPSSRNARVIEPHITLNYDTLLNIAFLVLAGVLLWRFVRTGGMTMLKMMGGAPPDETSVDAIGDGG